MAKILVILAGLFIAYWLLKRYFNSASRKDEAPPGSGGEDMVRCAKCGLHLPRSESVALKSEHFCSLEHARDRQPSDR